MERMLLCQRRHFLSIFITFETEKIPALGVARGGMQAG